MLHVANHDMQFFMKTAIKLCLATRKALTVNISSNAQQWYILVNFLWNASFQQTAIISNLFWRLLELLQYQALQTFVVFGLV